MCIRDREKEAGTTGGKQRKKERRKEAGRGRGGGGGYRDPGRVTDAVLEEGEAEVEHKRARHRDP
eukprot:609958-Rhodomonas_salina.1